MKIIIVGCGKVGYTLARDLSFENGVEVTIIDNKPDSLEKASETVDAMLVLGDGLNTDILLESGVKEADLVISVTEADEKNILCCILAKRFGVKHAAARVRNPNYDFESNSFWRDLGLDMIINPEQETAREVSRLLMFPTADDIDVLAGGRVELISFRVTDTDLFFVGKSVAQVFYRKNMSVLLAMIERDDAAFIPRGDFVFKENDMIKVLGRPSDIINFFSLAGLNIERIKNAVIVGGGIITYYLVDLLNRNSGGVNIKIIEIDKEQCEELSVRFPRCLILNGDGTDADMLLSDASDKSGAIVCLTDRDEDNVVIALYSIQLGLRKVITKINHINQSMVKDLGLGSIVSPKNITSDQIIRYIRGLSDAGGDVATVYKIFNNGDDTIEAVEIIIDKPLGCLDTPIKNVKTKKNTLIGCIIRDSKTIIPSGESYMQLGDSVIIIAKNGSVRKLEDILEAGR